MSIDSTADLLFRIGANTDDGEANIQRFRALLGTDLDAMASQFSDWATKVFGSMATVSGMLTAVGAAAAASVVAIGAAASKCADQYAEYVSAIERGSRITGISTQAMSGLHLMAQETGVSYDSLVHGLARFASVIQTAQTPTSAQAKALHGLGITQEQVQAGQKDMLPLLELVMDRMHQMGASVSTTAAAKALLRDRTGELTRMLGLGGDALKAYIQKARELGETVLPEDIQRVEEYRAAIAAAKTEHEALEVVVGRTTMPIKKAWEEVKVAILKTLASTISWKEMLVGLAEGGGSPMVLFLKLYGKNLKEVSDEADRMAKSLAAMGGTGGTGGGESGAKKTLEDYRGLSDLLSEVKTKMADLAGPEAKAADEARVLEERLQKAIGEYQKRIRAGEMLSDAAKREMQSMIAAGGALPELIAGMAKKAGDAVIAAMAETGARLREELLRQGPQTLAVKLAEWDAETAAKRAKLEKEAGDQSANLRLLDQVYAAGVKKIWDDAGTAELESTEDLQAKIAAQGEQTFDKKRTELNREIQAEADKLRAVGQLNADSIALLEQLRKAGLDKIAAEEKTAADTELARLGEQLSRIEREHQTSAQRIEAQYQADVAKWSAAEEKKSLATAVNVWQRAAIMAQFAAIQEGLYDKEQADLQTLLNSQGWQGVFGSKFAQAIKGNEALLKEWQQSSQQAHMMVRVSLEALKEDVQQTFEAFAQGMAQGIAQAIVYQKSIGEAMKEATKQALAELSARALGEAIYSTALGLLCLAEGDFPGAAAAFEAAAIFGSVGVAAGVAGRAIHTSQPGGATTASGSGMPGSGSGASDTITENGGTAAGSGQQHVNVYVYGHVYGTSGVIELTNMINDAVYNSSATLTATNTLTGRQVQR